MGNYKHIVAWVVIIGVLVLLVMKFMDQDRTMAVSVTEFLELSRVNAPEGEGGLNGAFVAGPGGAQVIDTGGSLKGQIAENAVLLASADFRKRFEEAKAARRLETTTGVPFQAKYLGDQGQTILDRAEQYGISYKADPQNPFLGQLLITLMIPVILIVALWFLFIRQVQSSGNKAMSFGKSRAKLVAEGQVKVGFDDVAGVEEAKEELREVVDFLKDPKKFSRLGGRSPKGILLDGPPGTGKTLLAKAVAGEANVPFFSISGSDFVEMFVGVGASRVRDLFEQAKKSKPCLIFIDEIDAVGRSRFAGIGGGHDEREQTLNQLLVEMDGFATNEGVILIAATNRPDVLDQALLRPGRFDRQIAVDYPDVEGRLRILKVHAKSVKLATSADLLNIARGTPGYSGADLANIINEAALLAARGGKAEIDQQDLEEAKDRVMMGPERRSMRISDGEKHATAVHEAGHAIAARFTEGADAVHKITIIPRGRSLGLTAFLPKEEKHSRMKSELKAHLVGMLGGLVAEKLVLGDTSTGVGNDVQRVTSLARHMVCEYGMSDRLGPRTFGETRSNVFVGRDMGTDTRDYSEEMAQLIDSEVKSIVDEALERATTILTEQRDLLDRLTAALVERETVDSDEFEALIRGEQLPPLFRKGDDKDPPKSKPAEAEDADRKKAKAPRIGDLFDSPREVPG